MNGRIEGEKADSPSSHWQFIIGGEVRKPGRIKIPSDFSLYQAVEQAGGFKDGTPIKGLAFDGGLNGFISIEKGDTPLYPEAMMCQGINPGFGIVIEQIGIQPPAPQKFFPYFNGNWFYIDLSRSKINKAYLSF